MANIGSVLKVEITRLSRKAVREQTGSLQTTVTALRKQVSALKAEVAALQKNQKQLSRTTTKAAVATAATPTENIRFQAKGLKSLRVRLGLSADDLGKLVGVTGQSIYAWESGKTVPRDEQKRTIASLRPLGKKEAAERLAKL